MLVPKTVSTATRAIVKAHVPVMGTTTTAFHAYFRTSPPTLCGILFVRIWCHFTRFSGLLRSRILAYCVSILTYNIFTFEFHSCQRKTVDNHRQTNNHTRTYTHTHRVSTQNHLEDHPAVVVVVRVVTVVAAHLC